MKKWFLFYSSEDSQQKLQQAVGELEMSINQIDKNSAKLVEKLIPCHTGVRTFCDSHRFSWPLCDMTPEQFKKYQEDQQNRRGGFGGPRGPRQQ